MEAAARRRSEAREDRPQDMLQVTAETRVWVQGSLKVQKWTVTVPLSLDVSVALLPVCTCVPLFHTAASQRSGAVLRGYPHLPDPVRLHAAECGVCHSARPLSLCCVTFATLDTLTR